jgi:hypothetical protein
MKSFVTKGFIFFGVLFSMTQPALADWVESRCTYELTNHTQRRVYFFLNTKQTSLGVGETLSIHSCDTAPFPRVSLFQSHPFFSSPTVIFDAKLGDGYTLKTIQLNPGENAFTQLGSRLMIQN